MIQKRIISVVLSLILLISLLPASVFAEEADFSASEELSSTDAASDAEQEIDVDSSDICVPETSIEADETDSSSVADVTESAAAAPSDTYEAISYESEFETVASSSDAVADNDALFAGYVDRLFNGSSEILLASASTAGDSLTGQDQAIYDSLKVQIEQVANGEMTSTKFKIPTSEILGKLVFTAEDLGVEEITEDDLASLAKSLFNYNLQTIVNALLADCPYELYWYNKTTGAGLVRSYYPSLTDDGKLEFSSTGSLQIWFTVADNYAGSASYTTDSEKISAAKIAVTNAYQIISNATTLDDYNKLVYYRQQICDLTSYNKSAAAGSVSYGDPWQLIWVFDGDADTAVVCEGYSKAFQYLCEKTTFTSDKVRSIPVIGTMNGLDHMWNIVRMEDGANYLVDVTNCDTGTTGYPDLLFMRNCASGSPSTGYKVTVSPGVSFTYVYSSEALGDYSTNDLTLSLSRYEIPSHVHNYIYTSETEPTCTEKGCITHTCTCGDSYCTYTEALGHDYADTVTAPTLSKQGYTTHTCTRCGYSFNDTFVDPILTDGPVDLTAACSANGVLLTWKSVEYALSYTVFRKAPKGSWMQLKSVTDCCFTDADALISNTTYTYTVRPYYEEGQELSPTSYEGVTVKYLSSPVLGKVSNVANGIQINWNSVTGASRYTVMRKASGEENWTTLTTSCTSKNYTDKTAVSGMTYQYTVQATNSGAKGCWSSTGRTVTRLILPSVDVQNTADTIKLAWAAVPGADWYEIQKKTGSGKWSRYYAKVSTDDAGSLLTWSDDPDTVTIGTSYSYNIIPWTDADDSSNETDTKGKTIRRITQPSVPTVTSGLGFILAEWQKTDGATSYTLWRRETSSETWVKVGTTSALKYKDRKATAGTEYVYAVCGTNSGSSSALSEISVPCMHLAKPVIQSVQNSSSNGNAGLLVSWNLVAGSDYYFISRTPAFSDGSAASAVSYGSTYLDEDVEYGIKYTYQIVAHQNLLNLSSVSSAAVTSLCLQMPETISIQADGSAVTVTWNSVTDEAALSATKNYAIFRRVSDGTSAWKKIATVRNSVTSYSDRSATYGVLYDYSVSAVNGSYYSDHDNSGLSAMRLATPTLVSAVNSFDGTASGITLTWKAVKGAAQYDIYRKTGKVWDPVPFAIVSADTLSYTISESLVTGSSYTFTVNAVYDQTSAGAYNKTGKTCIFVETPATLEGSSSSVGNSLVWSVADGATGYAVYRKTASAKSWSKIKTITGVDNCSYLDTSAKAGTTYLYCIRALYKSSMSADSPAVSLIK